MAAVNRGPGQPRSGGGSLPALLALAVMAIGAIVLVGASALLAASLAAKLFQVVVGSSLVGRGWIEIAAMVAAVAAGALAFASGRRLRAEAKAAAAARAAGDHPGSA